MKLKKRILIFLPFLVILILGIIKLNLSIWLILPLIIVFLFPIVMGAIRIQDDYFIKSIHSLNDPLINTNHYLPTDICITFDDGIHKEYTPKVLDILKSQDVKAMFFIIGKNILHNESILKRILNEGHIVGNHNDQHSFWFDMKSSSSMLHEIKVANSKVGDVLGKENEPIYFRPPYGVTNPNLAKAIKNSGLISVGWNLRSMDTVAKTKSELLTKLKNETRAGSIILLHDRCPITVDTLTDYIMFCKTQGFTFTTLK